MIRVKNFGCRVNQAEIDELVRKLTQSGYEVDEEKCDVVIVNTCAVTQAAEAESRRFIKNTRANLIVATGCYVTKAPIEAKNLNRNVVVYTNDAKDRIIESFPLIKKTKPVRLRNRVFLKIQDGCKANCSYCIIPKLRPVIKIMPADEVLINIKNFAAEGYKEVVLCGIRLGSYFDRAGGITLYQLLKLIVKLPGDFRVRLSSLEPQAVSTSIIDLILDNPQKICPFLHFSIQSLSDKILKSMNRPYTAKHFIDKVEYIKKRSKLFSITCDVITGYPLETLESFEHTYNKLQELEVSGLHVFRYSPRPGTISYFYKSILPQGIIKELSVRMNELGRKLKSRFALAHEGSVVDVVKEDGMRGITETGIKARLKYNKPPRFRLTSFKADGVELVEE